MQEPLWSKTFRPSAKTAPVSSPPAELHFKGPLNTLEMNTYFLPLNQGCESGGREYGDRGKTRTTKPALPFYKAPCQFKTQANTKYSQRTFCCCSC